jgi:hypothetical protein
VAKNGFGGKKWRKTFLIILKFVSRSNNLKAFSVLGLLHQSNGYYLVAPALDILSLVALSVARLALTAGFLAAFFLANVFAFLVSPLPVDFMLSAFELAFASVFAGTAGVAGIAGVAGVVGVAGTAGVAGVAGVAGAGVGG